MHGAIARVDLDSASVLSSATGSPKDEAADSVAEVVEQYPHQGQQQQQEEDLPAAQHHRAFSGHLLLMEIEGSNSQLAAPSPPGSPAGLDRRPGSGAGSADAEAAAGTRTPPDAATAAPSQRGSPGKPAAAPFTPPSSYVDRADRTLFFARVASMATAEEVTRAFAACGEVEEVNLFRAWPTAKASKGCGLVVMATREGAARAIAALDRRLTWDGADGPMVVERCDPARLGVKAANAAACKAMRAATAASAAAARRGASGSSSGASGSGMAAPAKAGVRSAPIPQPKVTLAAPQVPGGWPSQRPGPVFLSATILPSDMAAATAASARSALSAPLLRCADSLAPVASWAAGGADMAGGSGPLAGLRLGASDDLGGPSAPLFEAEAALAGLSLGLSPQGQPPMPFDLLPLDSLSLGPQAPLAPQLSSWSVAPSGSGPQLVAAAANNNSGPLAGPRDSIAEEMAVLEGERCAAEAAAQQLRLQQQRLELLLRQKQEVELLQLEQQRQQQQYAAAAAAAAASAPAPLSPVQLQPPPPPQRPMQQIAIAITHTELASIRVHAPTLALLSGATLAVDVGPVEAASIGGVAPPPNHVWLLVSGSPPQLQSASTLISRLLGTPL